MNVQYLEKDQNWKNESTTYWFEIGGETYGVVESSIEAPVVVDCDGAPVNTLDAKNVALRELFDHVAPYRDE